MWFVHSHVGLVAVFSELMYPIFDGVQVVSGVCVARIVCEVNLASVIVYVRVAIIIGVVGVVVAGLMSSVGVVSVVRGAVGVNTIVKTTPRKRLNLPPLSWHVCA